MGVLNVLGKWVAEVVGEKTIPLLFVNSINYAHKKIEEAFAANNVLILGDTDSGKTALIQYITEGKPYRTKRGEKVRPKSTQGEMVVNKKFNPTKQPFEKKVKIPVDLGGEPIYSELWEEAIKDYRPAGIIYMVDGRKDKEEIEISMERMFNDVLSIYIKGNAYGLKTFHIFLNWADEWAVPQIIKIQKLSETLEYLSRKLSEMPHLNYVDYGINVTQLSPNEDDWLSAYAAILEFGKDLTS